jgi:hypothetical protein
MGKSYAYQKVQQVLAESPRITLLILLSCRGGETLREPFN